MKKNLDPKLTQEIQDWLNTPADERDTLAGATLYLRLSNNRALYNSVIRRPEKFLPKLEYELRKFLRIRLDNMTAADIVRLETEVMPRIAEIVDETSELPEDGGETEAPANRGRRLDHASLPPEIRDLWDSNGERYRKIVILFNEIKAMSDSAPCDRYMKLKILADLDKKYRNNLEAYDSYVATVHLSPDETEEPTEEPKFIEMDFANVSAADIARRIGAARKSVSVTKKQISELPPDDSRKATLLEKIQEAVDSVLSLGGDFSDRQKLELTDIGITFNEVQ